MKNCLKRYGVMLLMLVPLLFTLGGCADVKPEYSNSFTQNGDLAVIRERLLLDLYDTEIDPTELMKDLNADGSFRSIPYDTKEKDTWYPAKHLKNIVEMQKAAYTKGNPFYQNEDLIKKTNEAIRYWVTKNYVCDWNGWWNGLGTGPHIAEILLFPNEGLEQAHVDWLLSKLESISCFQETRKYNVKEREIDSTGGNLTDKVNHSLVYAVIAEDGNKLHFLTDLMENELRPFPAKKLGSHRFDVEGIKADMSFQQHFELLYLGGYGEVFCNGMNTYIAKTAGTQFALSEASLNVYQDFLLDGMQYAMRGKYRDINASGRGIVRKDEITGIHSQVTKGCNVLLQSGAQLKRAGELASLLQNRTPEKDAGAGGHKYFWSSDYQAYNEANYMATVRCASKRTKNSEALNGENIWGHYLGAGAAMYYVKGDEYFNIFPLWDWNRIPGTTSRQGFLPKGDDKTYARMGKTGFVGGVSTGTIGMSCFDYRDNGVTGKKAYFMFSGGVMSLGAELSSSKAEPVYTNINQTLLRGDVVYGQGGAVKSEKYMNVTDEFDWLYNNKIGYIFDAKAEIKAEKREGDWKTISDRVASEKHSDDVLEIGIPHGTKPNKASYAYFTLMNTTPEETAAYRAAPSIITILNTGDCQAVWDTDNAALQAVFWKKGELKLPNGQTIAVSKGCSLIYTRQGDAYRLYVSDPAQRGTTIKVSVDSSDYQVKFEKGMYAGATQEVKLKG